MGPAWREGLPDNEVVCFLIAPLPHADKRGLAGSISRSRGHVMIIIIVYIGLCLIIAWIGCNRKFGFWGYFFCSLFLTPVIGALVLLASDERPKRLKKCPKCSHPLCEIEPDPH
jgi:hypothetical protein